MNATEGVEEASDDASASSKQVALAVFVVVGILVCLGLYGYAQDIFTRNRRIHEMKQKAKSKEYNTRVVKHN
jgi:hypothetical protein